MVGGVKGGRPGGWMRAVDGRERKREEAARQTLGCMRQVHTSSRPTGIQRLSTIQTRLSRSFALSFAPSFLLAATSSRSFVFLIPSLSSLPTTSLYLSLSLCLPASPSFLQLDV